MSVDVQTMLEEARTLVAAHEYARAKSSLLVASYLHPADAAISFEHWRVCCLANERNPATRILTSVCASSEHLESFCALLVEELRGVAQGGGENSFVREGWLASDMDSCKQILTCCLIKLSKRKDTLTAEERRSVLFHLASMSKDHALVWWAASELAFEADAQVPILAFHTSAFPFPGLTSRVMLPGRRRHPAQHRVVWDAGKQGELCSLRMPWPALTHCAVQCLPILLRGGGMAMGEEELARVKPLVERAALHHFCAAQVRAPLPVPSSFFQPPLRSVLQAPSHALSTIAMHSRLFHAVAADVHCGEPRRQRSSGSSGAAFWPRAPRKASTPRLSRTPTAPPPSRRLHATRSRSPSRTPSPAPGSSIPRRVCVSAAALCDV